MAGLRAGHPPLAKLRAGYPDEASRILCRPLSRLSKRCLKTHPRIVRSRHSKILNLSKAWPSTTEVYAHEDKMEDRTGDIRRVSGGPRAGWSRSVQDPYRECAGRQSAECSDNA